MRTKLLRAIKTSKKKFSIYNRFLICVIVVVKINK